MALLRKIFNVLLKILLGIFVLYLVIAWIVIPLVAPRVAEAQASKILNTPVRVRSVQFDPFFWKARVDGLQVLDADKTVMVAFDRLSVDVSFLDLFKKVYRVESVVLDKLLVHAALVSEGKINLMDLVPAPSGASSAPAEKKDEKASMPLVFVDAIVLQNGRIEFEDKTVVPSFKTVLSEIDITVKGVSTQADSLTDVTFKAKLDDKGVMDAHAQLKPLAQPLEMELNFGLNQYALTVLSPYTGKYTSRELQAGKLDFKTSYRIADNKLTASHKVLVQNFTFGKKVESKDALGLPFGLAVALLEDPQGRINISLPVKGDMSDPEFKYTHLIWQVVRNFFTKLVTKPFAVLGSLIGSETGEDELGYVSFPVGRDQITEEEQKKLELLVKGLKDRPKLLLEINGSFDPDLDWKAIKTEIFRKDYETLKTESTRDEDWIYQSLYQRRFGVRDLWKLTKSFKLKSGGHDSQKMNAEIKRQLIEDASADKVAMDVLAQSRAKNIYDKMVAAGLDPKRVTIGNSHEVQGSMGAVPLELTLTVFESQNEEPAVPRTTGE